MKKTNQKSIRGFILSGLAAGSLILTAGAVAADNKVEATSDTSKNPITGTVTDTTTYDAKVKTPNGKTAKRKMKEKVKHKTDGSVEKKVEDSAAAPN